MCYGHRPRQDFRRFQKTVLDGPPRGWASSWQAEVKGTGPRRDSKRQIRNKRRVTERMRTQKAVFTTKDHRELLATADITERGTICEGAVS